MADGAVDVTIGAPPDEVWAKVGDFGGVELLFPAIESFRLEGDQRVIGMFGMEIRERLAEHVTTRPALSATRWWEGSPIDTHLATIVVEARR